MPNQNEVKTKRKIKPFEELTIQDNFMFQQIMLEPELCKHLIELVTGLKIKQLSYPEAEKTLNVDYDAKGIRLDVYVEDEYGNVFDAEMQLRPGSETNIPHRLRYYQAIIDIQLLKSGNDYEQIKRTFIIFICTFDLYGKGLPIYTFREQCQEDGSIYLKDETTKIILNTKFTAPDVPKPLAAFLRYVDGLPAEDDFTSALEKRLNDIKKTKKARDSYMTLQLALDEARREAAAEAAAETSKEKSLELIRALMSSMNWTATQAMQALKIAPAQQQELAPLV